MPSNPIAFGACLHPRPIYCLLCFAILATALIFICLVHYCSLLEQPVNKTGYCIYWLSKRSYLGALRMTELIMLSICQYTTVICFIYQRVTVKSISKCWRVFFSAHPTGRSNTFSTIPVYQTLEETVNWNT